MREIIYNDDNISNAEVNNIVKRAKALIVNEDGDFLLGYADNTYQCIGGRLEKDETYETCLSREIKEESGIEMTFDTLNPFLIIKYYCKDYPQKGINSCINNQYFLVDSNLKPNGSNRSLTDEEIAWNFEVRFVKRENVFEELNKSLELAKNKKAVLDTIEAVREYLNSD